MQHLKNRHPKAAELHAKLPSHIVDNLGRIALNITHEDMHPHIEWRDALGIVKGNELDFSAVITDPSYDAQLLESDALELAKKGEEEVASIVYSGYVALKSAYDELLESGYSFGTTSLEDDKQRQNRENDEREDVYDFAYKNAIAMALEAKQAQDQEECVRILESVLLLRYTSASHSMQPLREAVIKGMAQELLIAAQKSTKLYTDIPSYKKLSHSLFDSESLLEIANGVVLNKLDFSAQYTLAEYLENGNSLRVQSLNDVRDLLAVMCAPRNDYGLTFEQGLHLFNTWGRLFGHINKDATPGKKGSAQFLYEILSYYQGNNVNVVMQLLSLEDPFQALETMYLFNLQLYEVLKLFGKQGTNNEVTVLDNKVIDAFKELQKSHPQEAALLISIGSTAGGFPLGEAPIKTIGAIKEIARLGLGNKDLIHLLTVTPLVELVVAGVKELKGVCDEQGTTVELLLHALETINAKTIRELLELMDYKIESMRQYVSEALTKAQLTSSYMQIYKEWTYPLTETPFATDLKDVPLFETMLGSLGLPKEICAQLYTSWSTYNAFRCYYKSPYLYYPEQQPEENILRYIANDQASVVFRQFGAIKKYYDDYGKEALEDAISLFGIYNFFHIPLEQIKRQTINWKAGKPVRQVIVDPRYDWNNNDGSKAVLFDETIDLDGIYYFEANSPHDTARIAIQIGQHERKHGREPLVEKFIIHGHANNNVIRQGVDGEAITVKAYEEAAKAREKIPRAERNDYTRHLGSKYEIILYGCSTATTSTDITPIAQHIRDGHGRRTTGHHLSVRGLRIHADGSVTFVTDDDSSPVIYEAL